MSGLKSAWELSLEKSEKLVPELKKNKKLSDAQKKQIQQIRNEYKAKIADRDVTLQDKLNKLSSRTPPEELEVVAEELRKQFVEEKQTLDTECEQKIEAVRASAQTK